MVIRGVGEKEKSMPNKRAKKGGPKKTKGASLKDMEVRRVRGGGVKAGSAQFNPKEFKIAQTVPWKP